MGFLRKSKRVEKGLQAAMASMLTNQDMLVAQGLLESKVKAERFRADAMLQCVMPKVSEDMQAHYQREVDRIKADYERQAREQTRAYEDKCRREYDERVKIPKAQLKREVMSDLMIMSMWVLQNKLDFSREQLHHFLHQLFLLEADMQEPKLGPITINGLVAKLKEEGYDMQEDIDLIDELVEAEHERYNDLYGKPLVPRGSILDKWRPGEEARMKRLLCEGINFLTIGIILGRSEGACKARARKLWGTIDPEQIKKVAA